MAKWNLDYCYNEDGYSEGEIETELLKIVQSGENIEEIIQKDNRWPILYHLSRLRENIINWYSFDENASILEIGAGCGAITGVLCRLGKEVKSVELTKIRSQINYERHKKYDNWELITGNFHNINFDQKFDYIVLNGVFEYAESFTEGDNPYHIFLGQVKKLLNRNGKILIAIENRLGIKYFNGAREDHTADFFSGLNNYKGINFVKTFSKNQLLNIIEDVGFKGTNFYYPFYDYKFPEVIYTKEMFSLMDFNTPYKVYDTERLTLFDENEMIRTFIDQKVMDTFSNSFFCEISEEEADVNERILYAKLSNYRRSEFSIITKIIEKNGKRYATKQGLNMQSTLHVKKMLNNQKYNSNEMINLECEEYESGIIMPFLTSQTFAQKLLILLKKNKIKDFEILIKDFYNKILINAELKVGCCSKDFCKVFGKEQVFKELHWKSNMNSDLIFSNLFIEESKFKIIDYEWIFDFEIPVEYIIWRSLRIFLLNNKIVQKYYNYFSLLKIIGINDIDLIKVFEEWDNNFIYNYVGTINLHQYEKADYQIQQKELNDIFKRDKIISKLYIDRGEGYKDDLSVIKVGKIYETHFEIEMTVDNEKEDIKYIRWDPCEEPCQIKNLIIESNSGLKAYEAKNTVQMIDEWYCFCTVDPQYYLKGQLNNIKWLKISGEIKKLNIEETANLANDVLKEKDVKIEKQKSLINMYHSENERIKNSTIWKNSERIRRVLDKLKSRK